MFRFSEQLAYETFLILRTQEDIILKVHTYSCEVPVVLVGLTRPELFSKEKITKSTFTKIRPVGAEFFMRTDGQTHVTTPTTAVRGFADAPKMSSTLRHTA